MKLFSSILFFILLSSALCGQGDDLLRNLNKFLQDKSNDKSRLSIDNACNVDDVESDNRRYSYNLHKIVVNTPVGVPTNGTYNVDIICYANGIDTECVSMRPHHIRFQKDFVASNYESAYKIFEGLIILQELCTDDKISRSFHKERGRDIQIDFNGF